MVAADSGGRYRLTIEPLLTIVYYQPYFIVTLEYILHIYRFRQEYRLERKLLSTLTSDIGLSSVTKEDLSAMIESTRSSSSSQSSVRQHRNGISLVVVLHNDRLETFCDNQEETMSTSLSSSLLPQVNCSSSTNATMEPTTLPKNDFFDTPEFWSGSITWW